MRVKHDDWMVSLWLTSNLVGLEDSAFWEARGCSKQENREGHEKEKKKQQQPKNK